MHFTSPPGWHSGVLEHSGDQPHTAVTQWAKTFTGQNSSFYHFHHSIQLAITLDISVKHPMSEAVTSHFSRLCVTFSSGSSTSHSTKAPSLSTTNIQLCSPQDYILLFLDRESLHTFQECMWASTFLQQALSCSWQILQLKKVNCRCIITIII